VKSNPLQLTSLKTSSHATAAAEIDSLRRQNEEQSALHAALEQQQHQQHQQLQQQQQQQLVTALEQQQQLVVTLRLEIDEAASAAKADALMSDERLNAALEEVKYNTKPLMKSGM
jgi:hypothetical protein